MTIPQQPNEIPNQPAEGATPQPEPAAQPAPPPPPRQQPMPPTGGYFGARAAAPYPTSGPAPKSPAAACIMSVIPGLGQIYVGYYGLGFLHAFVVAGVFSILVSSDPDTFTLFPMLVVFLVFFMLFNIVDAGRRAVLYNLAIAGVPGVALPKPLSVPRFGGSIFAGSVFIVGGLIVLMHTRFEYSLAWLEDWWPVAPMLFGAFLIYRAVQDRKAGEK